MDRSSNTALPDRRAFVGYFSALGLGGTLFPGVLWSKAQERQEVTAAMVADAEKIAGLAFSDAEREMMLDGLNRNLEAYQELRTQTIPNWVGPAVQFDPTLPGTEMPATVNPFSASA
ncbi:MAG: hypothetical protein KY453_01955 [Gemmatimonadetes bacterium]|nr:hypothetical protein [Gemmatimonadota bacterium]